VGEIRYGREIGYKDTKHRFIWAKCEGCGNERWVAHRGKNNRHLCKACAMRCHFRVHSPAWNGGKLLVNTGYIVVKLDEDDFYFPMADRKGYVLQHRLVVTRQLNRCLLPWEVVHHKNGNRADNARSNLELLPTKKYHMVDTNLKSLMNRQTKRIKLLEAFILGQGLPLP